MNLSNRPPWLTRRKVICVSLVLAVAAYIYARPTLERWLGIPLPGLTEDEPVDRGIRQGGTSDGSSAGDGSRPARRAGQPSGTAAESSAGNESLAGAGNSRIASRRDTPFELRRIGRDEYESPAGLIYGQGPAGEHRLDHVMQHARDDPDRPVHGVFDGDRDEILALLDEVYWHVQTSSDQTEVRRVDGRDECSVALGRRVGFVGGREGRSRNHPPAEHVRLILEGRRVITAYPY